MTNFKKSFGVSVLGLLALAFCCVLIAQSATARDSKDVLRSTPYYEEGAVPLPGTDDVAVLKKAVRASRHEEPVMMLDGVTMEDVVSRRPLALPSSLAAMQGGEDIGTAAVITPGSLPTSLTGTTAGYADDYADPCGFDGTSPDVVYSYTPIVDEYVNFDMCASGYDTKLWVVEAAGMTVVACNDDGPDCSNYQSQIDIVAMPAGLTFYIVIGGYYYPDDEGPYQLDLALFTLGDDCLAAQAISQEVDPEVPATQTASWAVNAGTDVTTCGGFSAVGFLNNWHFIYTANVAGLYEFTFTDDGTNAINSIVGLEGGYGCTSVGAPCLSYDFGSGSFTCGTVMMPGWTYRMAVGSGHPALETCPRTQLLTGTLTMTWTELIAQNDECADIEIGNGPDYGDLGVGNQYHFVHNVLSTLGSEDHTFCDNLIPSNTCGDVWYTWEADETGFVQFDMCEWGESTFDSKLMVYRGGCGGTIDPFGCSDDGCGNFGDGGYIDMACTAGEVFTIRLAGWFDGESACASSGMGTGYIDVWQTPTTTRPWNDNCPDAAVGVIPPEGGVYTQPDNNLYLSQWGSCPTLYNVPDGSIGPGGAMAWMVFNAFSISACTDIRIDFCGADDTDGRVNYTNWPAGINIWTGCPCEGPLVTVPTAGGTYTGVCDPLIYTDPDSNFSRGWDFPGLLPGTYYNATSSWHLGYSAGNYIFPHDFPVNFRGTTVECTYCDAWSNINSCPPVAGASWIRKVDFDEISTDTTDCNSYEDHTTTQPNPLLYKGLTYELSVLMGKVGIAGEHDSCVAWIDWNQNSGFAAFVPEINERIDLERLALTWTVDITVPMDAMEVGEGATEVTYMRIRMGSDADGPMVPCGEKVWGEVEDFIVEVGTLECGDFTTPADGVLDATDIDFLTAWYFGTGPAPDHPERADIDGDGFITLADIIGLVDAAYHGGSLNCI